MVYCCGITDKGPVRENNEDAFLINRIVMSSAEMESNVSAPMIAAVADGVGGEASGEVASRMALELLSDLKPSHKTDYEKKILSVHNSLKRYGITHNTENMQTTLCALAVDDRGNAVMINAGDSRMYLCRGGKIKQLSEIPLVGIFFPPRDKLLRGFTSKKLGQIVYSVKAFFGEAYVRPDNFSAVS